MKILLADDDFANRFWLRGKLTAWGYEVIEAEDGVAAWQVLCGDNPPPLAVLDWVMPGLDGLEVCRKARARLGRTALYIIMLTARAAKQEVVAGLTDGADEYLTKPCDADELQ